MNHKVIIRNQKTAGCVSHRSAHTAVVAAARRHRLHEAYFNSTRWQPLRCLAVWPAVPSEWPWLANVRPNFSEANPSSAPGPIHVLRHAHRHTHTHWRGAQTQVFSLYARHIVWMLITCRRHLGPSVANPLLIICVLAMTQGLQWWLQPY